ncbi:hypothetical protein PYCCODRAFT_702996 [Trametes coccinea BRFM310]|uniref:Uncharacterized protein n=1 Tax=Trametes coccinea (strain BRFM310) TaxID=1353009 RepID=A0A1Y2IJI1_TRAC3|nr:hypothetical protein PYCCODRAFT_702996 [Trametes coccinea BRFM310]
MLAVHALRLHGQPRPRSLVTASTWTPGLDSRCALARPLLFGCSNTLTRSACACSARRGPTTYAGVSERSPGNLVIPRCGGLASAILCARPPPYGIACDYWLFKSGARRWHESSTVRDPNAISTIAIQPQMRPSLASRPARGGRLLPARLFITPEIRGRPAPGGGSQHDDPSTTLPSGLARVRPRPHAHASASATRGFGIAAS